METKYKETRSLSNVKVEGNTLVGYCAVYGKRSENLGTVDRPLYEVIIPGAFTKSLGDGHNILALYNHELGQVLGSTGSGTLRLKDDNHGLRFEIDLPDTSYARDLKSLVSRGDVAGGSFRFDGVASTKRAGDGMMERTLKQIDVMEVTVTPLPAYPDTSVALRNLDDAKEEEKKLVLVGIDMLKKKFELMGKF